MFYSRRVILRSRTVCKKALGKFGIILLNDTRNLDLWQHDMEWLALLNLSSRHCYDEVWSMMRTCLNHVFAHRVLVFAMNWWFVFNVLTIRCLFILRIKASPCAVFFWPTIQTQGFIFILKVTASYLKSFLVKVFTYFWKCLRTIIKVLFLNRDGLYGPI